MAYKIILWGTGKWVEDYLSKQYFRLCEIIGFVDTYRKDTIFHGKPVFSPDKLPEIMDTIDYLVLSNIYWDENLVLCNELGIRLDKIVLVENAVFFPLHDCFLKLKKIAPELYETRMHQQIELVQLNESDSTDSNTLFAKSKYRSKTYMREYFRYRTFELVAEEIVENHVPGAVAEFGVFRGAFSAMINEKFKDRRLYLFDTFEGFDPQEAKREIELKRCNESFVQRHKDTSVEQMLSNLPYVEQCVVCKGLFPDSITEEAEKEQFAFVSIDVDFEESSYQGLKFFYPRLSEGGAIFLHDYKTYCLEGIKRAVLRFEHDFGIKLKKVPLADRAGTLVIVK